MLPLLLLGCRPTLPISLQAEPAEDAVLGISVAWEPTSSGALWLERTLPSGEVRRDPVDPSGGTAVAIGHPPLSTVSLRLADDTGAVSEAVSVTLGNLPPEVPTFSVSGAPIPPGRHLLLCTSVPDGTDTEDITVVLDPEGQVVWYHGIDEALSFRHDAMLAEDGWWTNRIAAFGDDTPNVLQHRSWDGTLLEEIDTPDGHHVFDLGPDGFAWPRDDVRKVSGAPRIGDALMVNGDELFSTWDDLDPAALIANTPDTRRHVHTNGLQHHDGRYLMTMGVQDAMLEVDAQTGEPLRWLGDPPPAGIDLEAWTWDEDEAMVMPHMAHWTEDGTLLVTGSDADYKETWATEFTLEDGQLTPIWTHGRGERLGTPALGHAARLSDGDTLVNFGTRGVIQRVSPDATVEGELSVELGRIFGRAIEMDPLPLLH